MIWLVGLVVGIAVAVPALVVGVFFYEIDRSDRLEMAREMAFGEEEA